MNENEYNQEECDICYEGHSEDECPNLLARVVPGWLGKYIGQALTESVDRADFTDMPQSLWAALVAGPDEVRDIDQYDGYPEACELLDGMAFAPHVWAPPDGRTAVLRWVDGELWAVAISAH